MAERTDGPTTLGRKSHSQVAHPTFQAEGCDVIANIISTPTKPCDTGCLAYIQTSDSLDPCYTPRKLTMLPSEPCLSFKNSTCQSVFLPSENHTTQMFVSSPGQQNQESQCSASWLDQQNQESQCKDVSSPCSANVDDNDVGNCKTPAVPTGSCYASEANVTVAKEECSTLEPNPKPQSEPSPKTSQANSSDVDRINAGSQRWPSGMRMPSPAYFNPVDNVNPSYPPWMSGTPSMDPCLSFMNPPDQPGLYGDTVHPSSRYCSQNMMNFDATMPNNPAAAMMGSPSNCRFHPSPEVMHANQEGMAMSDMAYGQFPMQQPVDDMDSELSRICMPRKTTSMARISDRTERMIMEEEQEERQALSARAAGDGSKFTTGGSCYYADAGPNLLLHSSVNRYGGFAGSSSNLFSGTAEHTRFKDYAKGPSGSIEQQEVLSEIVKSAARKMGAEVPLMRRLWPIPHRKPRSFDDRQDEASEIYSDDGICKSCGQQSDAMDRTNPRSCSSSPVEERKEPSFEQLLQAPERTKSVTDYRSFTSIQSPAFERAELNRAMKDFVESIERGSEMLAQKLDELKPTEKIIMASPPKFENESQKSNWLTNLGRFFGIKTKTATAVQTEGEAKAVPSGVSVGLAAGRRLDRFTSYAGGLGGFQQFPQPSYQYLAPQMGMPVMGQPAGQSAAVTPSGSQEFNAINQMPIYRGTPGDAFRGPFRRSLVERTTASAGTPSPSSSMTKSQELSITYERPEYKSKPKKKKPHNTSADRKPSERSVAESENDWFVRTCTKSETRVGKGKCQKLSPRLENRLHMQDKKSDKKETESKKKSDKKTDTKDKTKKKKKKGGSSVYSFKGEEAMDEIQLKYGVTTSTVEKSIQVDTPLTLTVQAGEPTRIPTGCSAQACVSTGVSTCYPAQPGVSTGASPCYSAQPGVPTGVSTCYPAQPGVSTGVSTCYPAQTGVPTGNWCQNAYTIPRCSKNIPVYLPGCSPRFSMRACNGTMGTQYQNDIYNPNAATIPIGAACTSPCYSVPTGAPTCTRFPTADSCSPKEKGCPKGHVDLRGVRSISSAVSVRSVGSMTPAGSSESEFEIQTWKNPAVPRFETSKPKSTPVDKSQKSKSPAGYANKMPIPALVLTRPTFGKATEYPFQNDKARISALPKYTKSEHGRSGKTDKRTETWIKSADKGMKEKSDRHRSSPREQYETVDKVETVFAPYQLVFDPPAGTPSPACRFKTAATAGSHFQNVNSSSQVGRQLRQKRFSHISPRYQLMTEQTSGTQFPPYQIVTEEKAGPCQIMMNATEGTQFLPGQLVLNQEKGQIFQISADSSPEKGHRGKHAQSHSSSVGESGNSHSEMHDDGHKTRHEDKTSQKDDHRTRHGDHKKRQDDHKIRNDVTRSTSKQKHREKSEGASYGDISQNGAQTVGKHASFNINSNAFSRYSEWLLLRRTDSDASSQPSDLQVAAFEEGEPSSNSDAASARSPDKRYIDRHEQQQLLQSMNSNLPMHANLGNTNSSTKSRFAASTHDDRVTSGNEVRFVFPRFAHSEASQAPTLNAASQYRGAYTQSFQSTWKLNLSSGERKFPDFTSLSRNQRIAAIDL